MDAKDTPEHIKRPRPAPGSAWAGRILGLLLPLAAPAADRYVNVSNLTPLAPYTNWATAATVIQDAIDAASTGDTVWVTNGVYVTGGRAMAGVMTNRIAIDEAIAVRSVKGPSVTHIVGSPAPGTADPGPGAVRCAWVASGATLQGFTLTNGFTRATNGFPAETCGGGAWCPDTSCVISQCVIEGNAAYADGGGALGGTLAECIVRFNTAQRGGGIASNTAANSFVARNVAMGEGGGAFASRLTHCSVLANRAATAGGMRGGAATNSIVYFNAAVSDENHSSASFVASYTRPLPWGQANMDADPGLGGVASPWLLPGSPCIDAGLTPLSIGALDLDGQPRLQGAAVDIGSDEFLLSAPADPPLASILAPWTELATNYGMDFQADTRGQVSFLGWDFGDGAITSGVAGVTHAFAEPGTYEVRLVASNLAGVVSSVVTVRVERAERFVAPSGDDLAPGTNWATAKATIQGGVDACSLPGTLVWVTNGIYAAGGRTVGASMTNRVTIDRPVRVFSVEGPSATSIVGARSAGVADGCSTDSVRCVWMTNGAWIVGFTLTNGFSSADTVSTNERSGGGAWCTSRSAGLSNCVIRDCGARFSGGGARMGLLLDCEISGCAATNGGGVVDARLERCLVTSNRAEHGAGAFLSDSRDSVFLKNVAAREGGGAKYGFHDADEFRGNTAVIGGGANQGLMRNCLVAENTAGSWGGGSFSCTSETCLVTGNVAGEGGGGFGGRLFNCGVIGNRAAANGGGARSARLINCTVAGNRAPLGPGTHLGTMYNSIVYFNTTSNGVWAEFSGGTFEYSCTMPMPAGPGNITNMPMLAGMDNPRLLLGSPCIDAGTNGYAWGDTDLYRKARVVGATVDIGCDEFADGPRLGAISVVAAAGWNAWAAGHPGGFSAFTTGAVGRLVWDFGDGVLVTNDVAPEHAFALPGTYDVHLFAGNDDGVSTSIVQVVIGASPLYVAPGGDDAAAGTNWVTAKATLQAAVDASALAGTVWVTSGVYAAGGRIMEGTLSNRVAIHRRMYVRSVDGPEWTFIVGAASPTNTGLGAEAVRCAWLTNGAVLAGFTLTNGFTRYVNEEWSPEEIGGGAFGTSTEAVLSNCVLQGNGAARGGGAGNVTIVDSTLVFNRAISYGGGAYYCFVSNCVVASNWAGGNGGGVGWSRVERSRIEANWASGFGGMGTGTSRWCMIVGNRTPGIGGGCGNSLSSGDIIASNHADIAGGAYQGWLFNCFIHDNRALSAAGGAYEAGLYNCTVVWNTMEGTHQCVLRNTISYFNSPLNNVAPITTGWNCSWPLISGSGCITNEPMLAGRTNPHLLPGSPCINAANTEFPPNTNLGELLAWDVDGEARTNGVAVDIGCDEFVLAGCTGAVGATLSASWTNVAPGYPISIDVDAEGRLLEFALDAPGATILSNGNYRCDLAFATQGIFPITATAGNLGSASTATISIVVSSAMGFVAPHGSNAAPGTNWATAKATLQAAADDYLTVGGTIWVTNGVYAVGGRVVGDLLTNRVAFPRPVTMRSVNGPVGTFILGMSGPTNSRPGEGAVRCAWLSDGVTLSGFTLTNGHTEVTGDPVTNRSGGGAWCAPGATIDRCRIARCSAADSGGGVYSGLLRSSVLFDNYAERDGGGAHLSALSACSVVSNRATHCGGGVSACAVTNSIVYFNASASSGANHFTSTTERCCSAPSQAGITTTVDPRFMNRSIGNLALSNGSPCVNMGVLEPGMVGSLDLGGNPRVIGGTVDIGAYEFTGGATASGIPWQWLLDYDLATDGTADGEDVDGDRHTAYDEHRAGTHPLDPLSTLSMGVANAVDVGDGLFPIFRWSSVSGRVYRVGLSTNLMEGFTGVLADDVPATPPENVVTDRTDAAASFKVYRVEVK